MAPYEEELLKRPLPGLDMPEAFADYLRRFPFPPDWAAHPADSPLEMVAVLSHRPEAMKLVLANVCAFLPGAALTIVHGPDNREWVRGELLRGWDEAAHPGVRALQLLPAGTFALFEYTDLLERDAFWRRLIGRPRVLVIQPDTLLFRNTVLDFMNERYIGAPWQRSWHWGTLPTDVRGGPGDPRSYPQVTVGNGGLSLRCPRLMTAACRTGDMALMRAARPITPEDIAFARVLGPTRLAHPLRARRFAVETCPFALPMGAHKPWEHLPAFCLREMLDCAQEPPKPGGLVPRVWERPWRIVGTPGRWREPGKMPTDEELRRAADCPSPFGLAQSGGRLRPSGSASFQKEEAQADPGLRASITAWIRLGTNHQGFFCDEGAAVPLPPDPPAGTPDDPPAGVLCVRYLLVLPAASDDAAPAILPVSRGGVALRRCWVV
jgi:hypothetical protein